MHRSSTFSTKYPRRVYAASVQEFKGVSRHWKVLLGGGVVTLIVFVYSLRLFFLCSVSCVARQEIESAIGAAFVFAGADLVNAHGNAQPSLVNHRMQVLLHNLFIFGFR